MNTLKPNSTLQGGKYRIVRELGHGGFGVTYEGLQTGLNRRVAIKEFFMSEHCERDTHTSRVTVVGTEKSRQLVTRFRQKFIKEAQMIAGLDDVAHVVRIYDIFEENGTAYYVMQYLDGGSLLEKGNAQGAMPELEALTYILQVADALEQLHAQHIMHLDIKPSNIMLKGNSVFLIDFGISKHYDSEGGATTTTPVGRSKGFAPIEQYREGGVQTFSPETDIYSLGATAYALVTGKRPPEATELIYDPLQRPADISDALWRAISAAMRPNKNDRPHTIAAWRALLRTDAPAAEGQTDARRAKPSDDEVTIISEALAPDKPKSVQPFRVNGVSFNMIHVEGGTFTMGATPEQGDDAYDDEKPAHQVTLSSYYIGETVVTQALWEAVMGSNPSFLRGSDRPVENVSWDACQEFIKRLNSMTGRHFRLPTEAEWEFAARGGSKSRGYKYSGSNTLGNVAWYDDNSALETHPVKEKQANELGLYDMSGNVLEWCQDRYGGYNYSSQTNPTGPLWGSNRVLRGGSWFSNARRCRVANRFDNTPTNRSRIFGLRLAM